MNRGKRLLASVISGPFVFADTTPMENWSNASSAETKRRKMSKLIEGWNDYQATVLPTDASPIQCSETKKAYYAGCWAGLLCGNAAKNSDEYRKIVEELVGFMTRISDGAGGPGINEEDINMIVAGYRA